MIDKLEEHRADVARRQEGMLRSLARGRAVFLYSPELGILSRMCEPSSNAIKTAAPFFSPWLFGRRCFHAMGEIGIEVPILDLFLGGMLDSVLASLKAIPCARLAGLSWPNGVLRQLLEGRTADVQRYLDSVGLSSRPSSQWLEAACHWRQFPGKTLKVMDALEKADRGDPDTATAWYRLCGDHNSAATLAESWASQLSPSDWQERAHQLQRADFWGRIFGHESSMQSCLAAAELDGPSDGAVRRFLCATARVGLAGERERALQIAEKAMRSAYEFGADASLFWTCCMNEPGRAAECLTMPRMWADTVGAKLNRIEQMMLHGMAPQEAEALLHGIDWGSADPLRACRWLCRGAKHWWFHFGNSEKSKETLARAMSAAEETCDFLPIAETWLDLSFMSAADRALACKEVLHKAESISANPLDLVFCAREWVRLGGDVDRAVECLTTAESQADDAEDKAAIGAAWLELL